MNHRIRLGPIAVFLAVVTVVLSTLAVLTVSTVHADRVMAERFASVTRTRYELEAEGNNFLKEFSETAARGGDPASIEGVEAGSNGRYSYSVERDGYRLEVTLSPLDAQGHYTVTGWKIHKIWNSEDPMNNVWKGQAEK